MHRRVVHAGQFALAGALAGVAWVSGCGPIEYIAAVPMDAAGAYGEARHVNGEKFAPYEMTTAREYLHKARELAGFARFQSAVKFGQMAGDSARKATKIALEKAALPEENTNTLQSGGTAPQHVGDTSVPSEVTTVPTAAPPVITPVQSEKP